MSPCEAIGLSGDPFGLIVWFLVLSKPLYMIYVDMQEVGAKWGLWSFSVAAACREGSAGALLLYLVFGAFIVLNHPFVLRNIRFGVPAVLPQKTLPC